VQIVDWHAPWKISTHVEQLALVIVYIVLEQTAQKIPLTTVPLLLHMHTA
jgi:hypothetical protein